MTWLDQIGDLFGGRFVTQAQLDGALAEIRSVMATQADIDAITSQVDQVASDLATAQSNLQTEIDNLAAGNPQLDLTALQGAVAPLDAAVVALGELQPQSPPSP